MSGLPFAIRPETGADFDALDDLHRAAFEDDVVGPLVRALRQNSFGPPAISLVAVDEADQVIGHVMLSGSMVDAPGRMVEVMTLSPLAVAAPFRKQGLGGKLIAAALNAAEAHSIPAVFLEGNPAYYSRHGFRAAEPLGFRRPSLRIPEGAFQVALLGRYEPWMTGSFVYSDTFWKLDCVGLR